ncbi:3-hydroxyacyl-ACP dehydratase FabZ [bacterium]|nr:3-hydroxyacyl-ACP dehydratase FabZ [candidate division CSSED10-310 bacterium]
MPELDINGIQRYIYHRFPFLLVDRVLDYEPGKFGIGIKNVTINEPFFQGHFPDHAIMPGVLMIEAIAQLAAVVLGTHINSSDIADKRVMGYFASVKNFKFKQPVVPGDQLRLKVEFTSRRGRIYAAHGLVEVIGGKIAAEGDLMFALMNHPPK